MNKIESTYSALERLANLKVPEPRSNGIAPYLSIVSEGQGYKFTLDMSPRTGFFDRLFGKAKCPKVDDLRDLKSLYETALMQNVQRHDRFTFGDYAKYKIVVARSLDNLRKLYELYRNDASIEGMAHKNDILEAFSVAVKDGGLNDKYGLVIERIAADPRKPFEGLLQENHIPLFKMEDIDTVARLMEVKFGKRVPTLQEIHADPELRKYLIIEDAPHSSIVHWMYKHSWIGKILNNTFCSWALTKWVGWKNKKVLPAGTERTETILKFFKSLNICPETAIGGKLYSYSEMFEQDLRQEESCDAAFQRKLNANGHRLFMQKAKQYAECSSHLPVVSTSFCRLRMNEIPKGSAKTLFTIEGKQVSQTAKNAGSIQMMLGNENNVDTSFTEASPVIKTQDRQRAEYLYRCCLTNAVNRNDFTMIIQRLAPDDIHHYVESVGGRVLSHSESCDKLIKMLSVADSPQEKEQLIELRKYFQEHPSNSGVVCVRGTRKSVSTHCTKYEAPLAQNDRKIMMVEHRDGSISIHIFIGAAGINNVRITSRSGQMKLGGNHGAMGAGDDENGRDDWQEMATREKSIRLRSATDEELGLGTERGKFSKEGSTVVSLYTNFIPSSPMEQAERRLRYIDPQGVERHIEILTSMGAIIGRKVPI